MEAPDALPDGVAGIHEKHTIVKNGWHVNPKRLGKAFKSEPTR